MMRLIGIAGVAGSGKDTVADFLKAHYNFKSVAFADPIRAGMKAITGLIDEYFQHPSKEVVLEIFGKSPRQMMQTLGTEWGRDSVNEDLWLILASIKVKAYHDEGYHVAITDVRFANEAAYIRNNGGCIWHIKRGGAGTKHLHASEAGVAFAQGDEVINNNGTIEDLHGKIARYVQGEV